MNWMHLLTGALVGGVIGYFTNYIAVKMLFRPLKEIRVFGRALPFTPGVIPKRRGDLARAVGNAVSESLLGRDELTRALTSEKLESAFADGATAALGELMENRTLKESLGAIAGEESAESLRAAALERVSARVSERLNQMDLGHAVAKAVQQTVSARLQGSMLSMFISSDRLASFIDPIALEINRYIEQEGVPQINAFLESEADRLLNAPADRLKPLLDDLRPRMRDAYAAFMAKNAPKLAESFEIAQIVTDKINQMDIAELERMILSVMNRELKTLINLGAVLGFLIGAAGALL